MSNPLEGKTILLTGGTGSFGNKFAEMALSRNHPRRIIVFSRDELKQHEMAMRFGDDPRLSFFLGDVRDRDRLYRAFKAGIDLVVHAAALKQVPAGEYNPFETVKTNILGAQNVVDAAIDCEVPKVLALSTDKAVNPVNLYGATKLCAEKIFVQGNSYAGGRKTRFSCVRYGNVVGSRGSVVPVFREQCKSRRITVTDRRMTRFWLTLEQGVDFVIRCVGRMAGGEVFVPRLPSMGIMDLVEAIAPDCEVTFTGIRAAEKLHETLISLDEARHTYAVEDMYLIYPEHRWWDGQGTPDGAPLHDGFVYSSELNDWRLTIDQLHAMLEPL